jgi:hypothetical protein
VFVAALMTLGNIYFIFSCSSWINSLRYLRANRIQDALGSFDMLPDFNVLFWNFLLDCLVTSISKSILRPWSDSLQYLHSN